MLMINKTGVLLGSAKPVSRNFSYSGSWETGMEEWTGGTRGTGSARSGSYKVAVTNAITSFTITNPGIVTVTVLVYHRAASSSLESYRSILVKQGNNFPSIIAQNTSTSTTYASIQAEFVTDGTSNYTIWLSGGASDGSKTATVYFDDWSITGVV